MIFGPYTDSLNVGSPEPFLHADRFNAYYRVDMYAEGKHWYWDYGSPVTFERILQDAQDVRQGSLCGENIWHDPARCYYCTLIIDRPRS